MRSPQVLERARGGDSRSAYLKVRALLIDNIGWNVEEACRGVAFENMGKEFARFCGASA